MTFYLLRPPQRCLKTGVSTSIAQKAKNENTKIKPVLRMLSPEILNLSRIKKNEISMHILHTCRIWPLLWTSHKKWRGGPAGLGFDTGLKRTAVLTSSEQCQCGCYIQSFLTMSHAWSFKQEMCRTLYCDLLRCSCCCGCEWRCTSFYEKVWKRTFLAGVWDVLSSLS